MNLFQRIILGLGAMAITAMALLPPWLIVFQVENRKIGQRFMGYYPIWQANQPTDSAALTELFSTRVQYDDLLYFSTRLDTTRLVVQIAATLIVTILICALLRNRNKGEPKGGLLDKLNF